MGQYGGIVGGVVGAVIGSFVPGVGTYAGWMVGAALGGAYSASQQVIPGPKIGDIQQQTAQEGGPRPIVFGRSPPIAGNIIADGKPRKVTRRERQGKGGPKVETESVYRTYAVAFCEGPIRAFLQVWRNNTLVYDIEDPSMAAENAEFLKYARFFLGSYDQMPSPDLEGVLGVGNVTAHRGTAYMVLADEDLTDLRGMWSQWKVRVDAQEPDVFVTSKPYPVLGDDSSFVSAAIVAGDLKTILHQTYADDASDVSAFILDGYCRTVYAPANAGIESSEVSASFVAGELLEVRKVLDAGAEESQVSASFVAGQLKQVLISAGPATQTVGITASIQSGTLS